MRGRKPKPTHLRLVQGNRGKRPINAREPRPHGNLTEPPEWLTEDQRRVWTVAIASAPVGLLKRLDSGALLVWVIAAEMHERATRAQAKIDAAGGLPLLSASPEGYHIQSPYLPIINRQAQIMLKAASELGFTPSSRSRISVTPDDDEDEDQRNARKYFTPGR